MFSVIIPLYNKAHTIQRTLESVLAQSLSDFEVIVVNDGSSDGSEKIVETYAAQDPRIRLVNQANQGVSVARNTGVAHAKSDYVAFLDGDDQWTPEFLAEIKRLIDEFPGAGLYATGYYAVDHGKIWMAGAISGRRRVVDFFKEYAKRAFFHTSSVVMRTQTFTQLGGFTPGVRFWEDAELWMKVALAGYPIACSPTCCAMYDTNVSGQTTRPKSSPFGIGVHNLLLAKELDAHRNDPSFMRYYKKIGHYELCWLCTLFGTQELQRFSDVMHLRSVMPFKVSFYLFISKHPPITKTLKTCILWLRKLKDLASVIRHRILN